ncbi:hypothetical protein [Paracoccus beibuensis]|uniref:hypothetical protein n=1 Tax=Paracoccus beibuensis TaxID=547602 RepID=UPI00224002D1|nr:hypothetical protein [Paracoccus beibuensis]
MTSAATTVLIMLAIGLSGTVGWLAVLVLAVIAGLLLATVVHWMIEAGSVAMDGDERAPGALVLPDPMVAAGSDNGRGIGGKIEAALRAAGVTRFAQWDDAQVDQVAARIGRQAALIRRDDRVGQARALAAEGRA